MNAILSSLRLGWFSQGRVGLNIKIEISYNDMPVEDFVVYLPIEQSSVVKIMDTNLMTGLEMSLMQESKI